MSSNFSNPQFPKNLPSVGQNDWGGVLNDFLFVSHDVNGGLRSWANASDRDLNHNDGEGITGINRETGNIEQKQTNGDWLILTNRKASSIDITSIPSVNASNVQGALEELVEVTGQFQSSSIGPTLVAPNGVISGGLPFVDVSHLVNQTIPKVASFESGGQDDPTTWGTVARFRFGINSQEDYMLVSSGTLLGQLSFNSGGAGVMAFFTVSMYNIFSDQHVAEIITKFETSLPSYGQTAEVRFVAPSPNGPNKGFDIQIRHKINNPIYPNDPADITMRILRLF